MSRTLIALAGQPNSGKSTVFNMLTGARQHVANYPGVTVEKKSGFFSHQDAGYELVDLPGTYSLSSYSLEERVARDFVLRESPRVIINVVDASNLKRNLYLTVQLLELGVPMVLNLNMMDVALGRGMSIDEAELARRTGALVVSGSARKGQGKAELLEAAVKLSKDSSWPGFVVDYGPLEQHIARLEGLLDNYLDQAKAQGMPLRWLAVKLLENDAQAEEFLRDLVPDVNAAERIMQAVSAERDGFGKDQPSPAERHIAFRRHAAAAALAKGCLTQPDSTGPSITDRIDRLVCHRFAGPVILVGILLAIYQFAIVYGYELTNYTWPLLAGVKNLVAGILPAAGFLNDPLLRELGLWFMDSVNSLLNYIPIFFILFAMVAILEDSGYMPRMAFILDRIFRRYGLHGQSTLPMVLGGIYVGGCAVPGVMSCKAIPDEKARLATILTVPLMNCLAKVPLYVLIINTYFVDHKSLAMFFIATITLFMALPIAKVLTSTVLRKRESAPFIMEMPPYRLPTALAIVRRAWERVWLFVKKIVTVVAAVAVVVFVLMQFPGVPEQSMQNYQARAEQLKADFLNAAAGTRFAPELQGENDIMALLRFEDAYKTARMGETDKDVAAAIDEEFQERNSAFFTIIKPKRDREGKKMRRAFKTLDRGRMEIRMQMRQERINQSFLGILGRAVEPITQFAGFNWRINAGLLSALAAKESAVATLGAIYQQNVESTGFMSADSTKLEEAMRTTEVGFTPLHALALILFMALYPPCMAAVMMVKVQSGDTKWMVFAILYPMVIGLGVASAVYTGGTALGLTGLQAMGVFYVLAILVTVILGFTDLGPAARETPPPKCIPAPCRER